MASAGAGSAVQHRATAASAAVNMRHRHCRKHTMHWRAMTLLLLVQSALWMAASFHSAQATPGVAFDLIILQQPFNATGGMPFVEQPILEVVDTEGNHVNVTDVVTAAVEFNPTGYAVVQGSDFASVEMVDGFANFTDLYINEVGVDYTLVFTASNLWVESDPFNVTLGPPVKVAIKTQPGTATGGLPLLPQPVVELQDAGGNVYKPAGRHMTATVEIYRDPSGGSAHLWEVPQRDRLDRERRFSTRATRGRLEFERLAIDYADIGFQLIFCTNVDLLYGITDNCVISENFTVGIGPTAYLEVDVQPEFAQGGMDFEQQPVVLLKDAGGNVNFYDSESTVTVSIEINPSGATLYPQYIRNVLNMTGDVTQGSQFVPVTNDAEPVLREAELIEIGEPVIHISSYEALTVYPEPVQVRIVPFGDDHRIRLQNAWPGESATDQKITRLELGLTRPVVRGVANFTQLRIDKIGDGFRLRFANSADPTKLFVVSEEFDVTLGPAAHMVHLRHSADAWAGGHPFGIQPIVAIQDPGGNIVDTLDNIVVHVRLDVPPASPRNASLLGNTTALIVLGIAEFTDLEIDFRGEDYVLFFNSTEGNFSTTEIVDVMYSTEWMFIPDDAFPQDEFGRSVTVYEDTAAVGASSDDRLIREIQTITTSGGSTKLLPEIQVVRSSAVHQNEVQVITTFADPGETVGGEFSLSWGPAGPTFPLVADAYAELIKVHLEYDLQDAAGEVEVTRTANTDCDCSNAYVWSVTFRHLEGFQPLIIADGSGLTGAGAGVSVHVATPSTIIDGNFTLSIRNRTTPALPWNVGEFAMEQAISIYLETDAVDVKRSLPDNQRGYVWSVTFSPSQHNYDVPQMVPDYTNLTGYGAEVNVYTHRQGEGFLGGSFQLYFRDAGPSIPIPYNANSSYVTFILEDLITVDDVLVSRSGPNADMGYTWTVTFFQARNWTEEGYVMDPLIRNLEPIRPLDADVKPYLWKADSDPVITGMLTGTNAHVEIDDIQNGPEDPPWEAQRMGKPGLDAGAVYILNRDGERWNQGQKLIGHDTKDFDRFGWSVSMEDTTLVVGAPHAGDVGMPEVQTIACTADEGTFTLTWRLHETEPIPFDASAAELQAALEALPVLEQVQVDTSANAGDAVCDASGYSAVVTFVQPLQGDVESMIPDGDALLLGSDPDASVLSVSETVAGSRATSGLGSSDASTGAVYFWDYSGGSWSESQKLLAEPEHRALGALYGWDVALSGNFAVVGSPEAWVDGSNTGAIFMLQRSAPGAEWSQYQRLVAVGGQSFDKLGYSVAMHDSTVLAGAIGCDDGQGAVYVYKRPAASAFFLLDQVIQAPTGLTQTPVAQFGYDVSFHVDTAIFGAPGAKDSTGKPTGLAYVYDRETRDFPLTPRQTLRPTPAKAWDRVGHRVAVWNNTITVSSFQSTAGRVGPRQEVQLVRTTAAPGATIGNCFFLGRFMQEADGTWVERETRPIESDALASTLRAILMEDLRIGSVEVTRYGPNLEQGYRWFVTFRESTDPERLPLMSFRSVLTGDGAMLNVERVHEANRVIRGEGYVYTRELSEQVLGAWTEQAVLAPRAYQRADLFGHAMALYDSTVFITATNRDSFVSGVNSGAAFAFDLAFLNLRFEQRAYTVVEHDGSIAINILRCDPVCRVSATPPRGQGFMPERIVQYSTYNGDDWGTYPFVAPGGDLINRQPAYGRRDCRIMSNNTEDCKWIPSDGDGFTLSTFDFRGVADFSHHSQELFWADEEFVQTVDVIVTDDTVVEVPDETMHVRMWSPGMEATFGGDFWATVVIEDDGDSGVGNRTYFDKVYADDEDPPAGAQFGTAVELYGELAIVGAPEEMVDDIKGAGAAYVMQREAGVWSTVFRLQPPTPTLNARFGSGVDIHNEWAVVAAVGAPTVSFYYRKLNLGPVDEDYQWYHCCTQQPTLEEGEDSVRASHQFGSMHAVAISDGVAAVGARNIECVFVYRYLDSLWIQTSVLRSSTFRRITWLTTQHYFPAYFGASVDLFNRTLVVGSPRAHYGDLPDPSNWTEVEHIESHLSWYGKGAVYVYEFNTTINATQVELREYSFSHLLHWPGADELLASGTEPHYIVDSEGGIFSEQVIITAPDGLASDRFGEDVAIDGHHMLVGAWGSPGQPTTTWDFETGDLRGWRPTGTAFLNQPTWGDNSFYRPVYHTILGPNSGQHSGHSGRFWIGTFENRTINPTHESVLEEPVHPAGTAQGDGPQGTLSSEPFTIAGTAISFLIGGGCDIRKLYVELLVDNVPTLRATGECRETMRRVHWDVEAYRHRAGQIRIVDASSAGWAHINVDDFRFDWAMQEYTETPISGAAYPFRLKNIGDERACLTQYGPEFNLQCEWESQGKLVPGDKRPGMKFGFSVDLDDATGTAVVGAYLHEDVYQDWNNPGSAVGVSVGWYGMGGSMRADGGVNNGDVGGLIRTLYPDGNPRLRNLGSSGGSHGNTGAGGWDLSGDGTVRGGSGPAGASGGQFSDRGSWGGDHSRIDPYERGNPFLMDFVNREQAGRVTHPEHRAEGGHEVDLWRGAAPRPTGMVYVYRRRPEEVDGLDVLLMEPLWHVEQHTTVMVESTRSGDRFGLDVAVDGFTAMVGAPGDSTIKDYAGSVTVFDTEYQRLKFEKAEFSVTENFHLGQIAIRVVREGPVDGWVSIEYSTRDLTAVGVNQTHAQECFLLARHQRNTANCGDYTQTSGVLHFQPTETSLDFTVDINDDTCKEEQEEMFLVQLSLPGGVALRGEGYTAIVRIDDNDQREEKCVHPIVPRPHPLTCVHTTYQTTTTCEEHTDTIDLISTPRDMRPPL